jgi:hypothetical protein
MAKFDTPVMRIDLSIKRIYLNRATITLLGEPQYLFFKFDTPNERLIILPAFEETFNTYEIPQYYWRNKQQTCQIHRLPFLLSLMQKFGWKYGQLFTVQGIFQDLDGQKLVVFNLDEVVELSREADEV